MSNTLTPVVCIVAYQIALNKKSATRVYFTRLWSEAHIVQTYQGAIESSALFHCAVKGSVICHFAQMLISTHGSRGHFFQLLSTFCFVGMTDCEQQLTRKSDAMATNSLKYCLAQSQL